MNGRGCGEWRKIVRVLDVSLRNTEVCVYENIRGLSRSFCQLIGSSTTSARAWMILNQGRWQNFMLEIQTKCSSYPYKQLLRSSRPPRYNLNSQHDVTLQPDKRPRPRPWKLVFKQVRVSSCSPNPVQPSASKREGYGLEW